MKTFKRVILVLFVLLLIIGGFLAKTFYDAGEFKEISPVESADCRIVGGVLGSEDITIDPSTGMAFISSCDFRALNSGDSAPKGAVYGYDLKSPDPKLKELTSDFKGDFQPHGLGFYTGEDGLKILMVVNHGAGKHSVEIFEYKGGGLVHLRSVSSTLMHSPNDLIPVGPDKFYVTNDHGSESKNGRMLEDYLRLAKSYVLYYDGKYFRKVFDGLAYANGVNISPDGRTVYVAETVGRKIHVFDRDEKSGGLALKDSIEVETGVDNIEIDAKGNLWIGAHPKLLTFVQYSGDPEKLSPSEILKLNVIKGHGHTMVAQYREKGTRLSGSSVAAVYENKLLIGSVFDDKFLICTITPASE